MVNKDSQTYTVFQKNGILILLTITNSNVDRFYWYLVEMYLTKFCNKTTCNMREVNAH